MGRATGIFASSLVLSFLGFPACKTVTQRADSGIKRAEPADDRSRLLDVNDVSILVPNPKDSDLSGYIRLSDPTKEGAILSEDLFKQSFDLIESFANKAEYSDWAMVAARIDNCAKLLAIQPCQAQIRLVFQPLVWVALAEGGRARLFDDEAIHLAFNIKQDDSIGLYQDFYNLKKSALPASTVGPLGVHPILQKEGMNGPFGKKLKELILKYSLPSRYERVAVMNLVGVGPRGSWSFAASLPIHEGKILASPIPCQTEKVNAFIVNSGAMMTFPENTCGDLDANALITTPAAQNARLPLKERIQATDNALRINDPTKVFFGSTTCVNCHVASRRIVSVMGAEYLNAKDDNPLRYLAPADVTSDPVNVSKDNGDWGIRAFGWGETGSRIGITLYTLNDTMRVAHEINDLIREGKL